MNTLRNNVKLLGRLGQDPEIRILEKGNKVANFSLATGDKYKDKDGNQKDQTEWHNIVAWGNLAERCEKYLKKGKEVLIDGRLTHRSWEDKNGVKHQTTEVVVNELLFIGTKQEEKQ
ncbi:MAG: single-stranded DNA-binding protein [Bacteroidales bacterium]|nr:single-stranded DNA-binding protein [Bacteroidales bacterium]